MPLAKSAQNCASLIACSFAALIALSLSVNACAQATASAPALLTRADWQPHQRALEKAAPPLEWVRQKLKTHDLLIMDDAQHNAVEPWNFYADLLRDPGIRDQLWGIFIEIGPINFQPAVDAYLAAERDDPLLLHPLLQNASKFGWPYQTYIDFLSTVRQVNAGLPADKKLKVRVVDQPATWPLIRTYRDWEISQNVALARDYFMYKMIATQLEDFSKGRKALFLTNTRHAYKGVRTRNGDLHWNTATFFSQFHPGKTFTVRMHHAQLHVTTRPGFSPAELGDPPEPFYWLIRMEGGRWDCAHQALGYRPLALDLAGTPLGRAGYVGNHGLNHHKDQTMADAYDGLIMLGAIDQFHIAAHAEIFSPAFKAEMARRLKVSMNFEGKLTPEKEAEMIRSSVERSSTPRSMQPDPGVAKLPRLECGLN